MKILQTFFKEIKSKIPFEEIEQTFGGLCIEVQNQEKVEDYIVTSEELRDKRIYDEILNTKLNPLFSIGDAIVLLKQVLLDQSLFVSGSKNYLIFFKAPGDDRLYSFSINGNSTKPVVFKNLVMGNYMFPMGVKVFLNSQLIHKQNHVEEPVEIVSAADFG